MDLPRKNANQKRLAALNRGEETYVGILCANLCGAVRDTTTNRCVHCGEIRTALQTTLPTPKLPRPKTCKWCKARSFYERDGSVYCKRCHGEQIDWLKVQLNSPFF